MGAPLRTPRIRAQERIGRLHSRALQFQVHFGTDAGRGEVGVVHPAADRYHVGACVQEMGRNGVAQLVGIDTIGPQSRTGDRMWPIGAGKTISVSHLLQAMGPTGEGMNSGTADSGLPSAAGVSWAVTNETHVPDQSAAPYPTSQGEAHCGSIRRDQIPP